MTTLAQRFIEARGEKTPSSIARSVGISRSAIGQIENGKTKNLKAETALQMEKVTGYSARWLTTGLGEKLAKHAQQQTGHEGPALSQPELMLLELIRLLPGVEQRKLATYIVTRLQSVSPKTSDHRAKSLQT